jgi:S1 RNA binding domain protein
MSALIGKVFEGKISGIKDFGAFVEFEGKTGLVHISEVAEEYIKDIKSYLKEDQPVSVKVLSIAEDGKISLSIRKAVEKAVAVAGPQKSERQIEQKRSYSNNIPVTFEDMMSKFLKDSDEKMHVIKRNFESKRGSTRR